MMQKRRSNITRSATGGGGTIETSKSQEPESIDHEKTIVVSVQDESVDDKKPASSAEGQSTEKEVEIEVKVDAGEEAVVEEASDPKEAGDEEKKLVEVVVS